MNFGELLRQMREEAGFSQNALARAAGMNSTNISRIEQSRQGIPRLDTVQRLLRALGVPATDERAQTLLDAARKPPERPIPPAVLGDPLGPSARPIQSVIKDLRRAIYNMLALIDELSAALETDEVK